MSRVLVLLAVTLGLAASACNYTPIEDGARFGEVLQVKDFFTSVFLAKTDNGNAILFDAGYNKNAKPILEALESEGLEASDVTHIFLTHGHGDHVAGLAHFEGAIVLALEAEADLVREESPNGAELTRSLNDGEIIAADNTNVEVFSVPGHSAGNAAYLVAGALILGDSAILDGKAQVTTVAPSRSADPEQAERSLEALRQRLEPRRDEIDVVTFSHSGSTTPDSFFATE